MASLIELLPADINHPAGQCSQTTPDFTPVGLTQAIQCNDPDSRTASSMRIR